MQSVDGTLTLKISRSGLPYPGTRGPREVGEGFQESDGSGIQPARDETRGFIHQRRSRQAIQSEDG